MVRYTFIQIAKKNHPKTLSSKNTFVQNHFILHGCVASRCVMTRR